MATPQNIGNYKLKQSVRCSALFEDLTPTPVDPTSVFFQFRAPSGTVIKYEYGIDVELVKDSTGNYHVDVSADQPGAYAYQFYGTGTNQSAEEWTFNVLASEFFP